MTKQLPLVNVGVDVSKDTLDLHLLERDLSLSGASAAVELILASRSS